MYHTTCKCLINGGNSAHFINTDMTAIISCLEVTLASNDISFENINSTLKQTLIQHKNKKSSVESPSISQPQIDTCTKYA